MESKQPEKDYKNKFEKCKGRFEAIFDHTSAASKIINSNLEILKVNRAFVDLLGYAETEIVGTQIMDYACKDVEHHWRDLQDAMWLHGQSYFKLDACLVRKDGCLVLVHITTVLFQQDKEYFAFTVLDDFSHQKHLEETEKRLSMALENSRMAVWELDLADGSIIHTAGLKRLFGIQEPLKTWNKEQLLRQFVKMQTSFGKYFDTSTRILRSTSRGVSAHLMG